MTKSLLALAIYVLVALPAASQTRGYQAAAPSAADSALIGAWCDNSRRDGTTAKLTIIAVTSTSFVGEYVWNGTGPYTAKAEGQIVGGTMLKYSPHTNVRYELVNKGDRLEGTGSNLGRANSHWFVTFKKGAC